MMCAELIAIGPFSRKVVFFLDYPAERYDKLPEGSVISRRLFGILEGTSLSCEFAHILGISDPWAFQQHKIDLSKVIVSQLQRFGEDYLEYKDDVDAFVALSGAGFEFHFRPEA